MGRSQETYSKKEVRNKKEKKRKAKAEKRVARKDGPKTSFDDMIAYVDENGMLTDTPPDPTKKKPKNEEVEDYTRQNANAGKKINPIHSGIVSFYNEDKGYGFIKDAATSNNVFVHINNVEGDLKEGSRVEFEMGKGPKGSIALNVKKA